MYDAYYTAFKYGSTTVQWGASKHEPQTIVVFHEKAVGTVSFSRPMASNIDISMTQAGDLFSRHISGFINNFVSRQ